MTHNADYERENPCSDPALQQGYYAPTGYEVGPPDPAGSADCVAAVEKLKRYAYRPVVLTDDEVAALLAAQKAEVKRIDFLIDLLNRAREYVPDNTWLAEQIDSETAQNDGSPDAEV